MSAIFDHLLTVRADEIDLLGHANNLAYLHWMIDAALAHSSAQGWSSEDYLKLGAGWVVRSHQIKYLQSALCDNEIVVRTWVAEAKRMSSVRKYRILRRADEVLLATAATEWAFIDFTTRTLARVPEQVASAFEVVRELPTRPDTA